jgi:hypothetical protein
MVRRSIQRVLSSWVVDLVVRVIVVLSVAGSGFALYQNRELTKCVASYNNTNNARSVALTAATDQERAATRKADDAQASLFLSPILNKPTEKRTPADRTEIQRLFRAYQLALTEQSKERATADDARRDHPIPDPPSAVCG